MTIQAQILEVLKKAQDETHAATILITHDLGLIAELADRVVVMYAGKIVELGDVQTIFESPRHPYTVGLMDSLPQIGVDEDWLRPIPGQPPSLINRPPGCPFHPRCFLSQGRLKCREDEPPLKPIDESSHLTACHFADELEGRRSKLVEAEGSGGGAMTIVETTEQVHARAGIGNEILRIEGLVKHFPISAGILKRRRGAGACGRRRRPFTARPGRRSGSSASPAAGRPRSAAR